MDGHSEYSPDLEKWQYHRCSLYVFQYIKKSLDYPYMVCYNMYRSMHNADLSLQLCLQQLCQLMHKQGGLCSNNENVFVSTWLLSKPSRPVCLPPRVTRLNPAPAKPKPKAVYFVLRATLVTLLAFTTLTLLPPQAYAGHYTVSYSGGTVNGQPYTGNGPYGGSMGSSQVTCSGTITATFTWVPDYPGDPSVAPPAVVIKETCLAQWYANGGGVNVQYSGSADDGFGDPAQATTRPGQISQGVRYEIRQSDTLGAPLKSFSVQCSPKVSASATPNGVVVGVVQFTASPSPLMVVLGGSGINLNTQPEYLIGQQVNCSLTYPSDLTASNYHWTPANACQPFKQWKLTDFFYNDIDKPQTVQLILLTNQDLTQSTLTFYPKVPTSGIVQCTVDLTVPQGAHWDDGSTTKTVTAQSRYIGFRPPDPPSPPSPDQPAPPVLTAAFTPANGTIGFDPSSGQMSVGAAYTYQVKTPTEFITSSDTGAVTLFIYFTPTISVFSGNASFLNSPATLNVFTYPAFPPNWQNPEFNLKYLWNTDALLLDSHSTNIP